MPSFLPKLDARRAIYLDLVTSIESQLRDAYARLYDEGQENQSTIANKLGVGRSVVSKRLNGHHNMTVETVADMVWALRRAIRVNIFDPNEDWQSNFRVDYQDKSSSVPTQTIPIPVNAPVQAQASVASS